MRWLQESDRSESRLPKFSEQFVQQVAQATDIVELISQYVSLQKRGKEFVGICPFHEDHKPSMYVSPIKQIFKCFACGAGGGVYQFVMQFEKASFPEAVRILADRSNIPLPQRDTDRQGQRGGFSKNDLAGAVKFAVDFFQSQLRGPGGRDAMAYAQARGLDKESILKFSIGYAPNSWDTLTQASTRQGMSPHLLVAAGLVVRREGKTGYYDRFRHRLMFPIYDPQDRPVGFGGRALDDSEPAKYLNSPESILFDKSNQLYSLNWSRKSIAKLGQAVVVEGYLDALIPLQHGLSNVVATLGTSLTDGHVRLLSRYARSAVLVFDADVAGQTASERAMEVFLAQQLDVRVAVTPIGKDPCDYCLAEGPEALKRIIAKAPDALEYLWRRRQDQWLRSGATLSEQSKAIDEFLAVVVSSSSYGAIDEVRRGHLAQHISHLLNVPAADLQQQMRRLARHKTRSSRREIPAGRGVGKSGNTASAEREVLEVVLNMPELFDKVAERLDPSDFSDEQYRRIAERVWAAGVAGRLNLEELLASCEVVSLGDMIADLSARGEARGNYDETLAGAVEYMAYRRSRRDLQELKASKDNDQSLRDLTRMLSQPDVRRHPRIR